MDKALSLLVDVGFPRLLFLSKKASSPVPYDQNSAHHDRSVVPLIPEITSGEDEQVDYAGEYKDTADNRFGELSHTSRLSI